MVAVQFVKEEGFETLEADDADQAIAISESRSEIAVLFTNIDIPGKHERFETGPCGEQPPAGHRDTHRIGSCSVAAGRSAVERPLSRQTVSCGSDDGRVAFAGWPRGTVDAGARIELKSRAMSRFAHTSLSYQA